MGRARDIVTGFSCTGDRFCCTATGYSCTAPGAGPVRGVGGVVGYLSTDSVLERDSRVLRFSRFWCTESGYSCTAPGAGPVRGVGGVATL
eukprot:3338505-Rhodomonas_salina.1